VNGLARRGYVATSRQEITPARIWPHVGRNAAGQNQARARDADAPLSIVKVTEPLTMIKEKL